MAYDVGCSLEEVKYTEHTHLTVFILFCQKQSFILAGRVDVAQNLTANMMIIASTKWPTEETKHSQPRKQNTAN